MLKKKRGKGRPRVKETNEFGLQDQSVDAVRRKRQRSYQHQRRKNKKRRDRKV